LLNLRKSCRIHYAKSKEAYFAIRSLIFIDTRNLLKAVYVSYFRPIMIYSTIF